MHAGAVLHPFQVDHVRGEIGRGVSLDVVVFVGDKIRPRGPTQAAVLQALGLNRRVVERGAPPSKNDPTLSASHSAAKIVVIGPVSDGRQMILRHHQRHIFAGRRHPATPAGCASSVAARCREFSR